MVERGAIIKSREQLAVELIAEATGLRPPQAFIGAKLDDRIPEEAREAGLLGIVVLNSSAQDTGAFAHFEVMVVGNDVAKVEAAKDFVKKRLGNRRLAALAKLISFGDPQGDPKFVYLRSVRELEGFDVSKIVGKVENLHILTFRAEDANRIRKAIEELKAAVT